MKLELIHVRAPNHFRNQTGNRKLVWEMNTTSCSSHSTLQICAVAGFVTGIALAVNPEGYLGSKGVELKHLVRRSRALSQVPLCQTLFGRKISYYDWAMLSCSTHPTSEENAS